MQLAVGGGLPAAICRVPPAAEGPALQPLALLCAGLQCPLCAPRSRSAVGTCPVVSPAVVVRETPGSCRPQMPRPSKCLRLVYKRAPAMRHCMIVAYAQGAQQACLSLVGRWLLCPRWSATLALNVLRPVIAANLRVCCVRDRVGPTKQRPKVSGRAFPMVRVTAGWSVLGMTMARQCTDREPDIASVPVKVSPMSLCGCSSLHHLHGAAQFPPVLDLLRARAPVSTDELWHATYLHNVTLCLVHNCCATARRCGSSALAL